MGWKDVRQSRAVRVCDVAERCDGKKQPDVVVEAANAEINNEQFSSLNYTQPLKYLVSLSPAAHQTTHYSL